MTEYDSGSSSESSADSGSSSDSWSSPSSESSSESASGGGIDYSGIISSLIDNALTTTTHQSGVPSAPGSSAAPLLNPTIQALFLASSGPYQDERSLVRRIVEAERWYVITEPDGRFVRVRAQDERTLHAFTHPLTADGSGGPRARLKNVSSIITVLADDPGQPARELTGRELVRALPADISGLVVVLDAETRLGLRAAEFPLLTQLADALDLEQALLEPAPGQLPLLRSARWYVPAANQTLKPTEPGWGDPFITLYTHPDRAPAEHSPVVELDGLTLCTRLAGRSDYVGIDVNLGSPVVAGDQSSRALVLPPSFARGVARGVDPRPGGAPLPARTLAEIVLWLDLAGFPWEGREIMPASPAYTTPDTTSALIQIRAPRAGVWRIYESSHNEESRPGPILSPVFALARPEPLPASLPAPVPPAFVTVYGGHLNRDDAALSSASVDLGDGPTQILCAGKLAKKLYDKDHWVPGGWFVSRRDRLEAARLAGWANELLKLIPPGQDRLPLSSALTYEGTRFVQERPEFRERRWIEQQHQRHTRSASRWFTF